MARSSWKNKYLKLNFFLLGISKKKNLKIYTQSRNNTIGTNHIGKILKIHNGKAYISIKVTPNIVGHKLGEFSRSKKKAVH